MEPSRKPVAFLATTDPEGALVFYSEVMGLTLLDRSPFALVFDDQGLPLRVQIVQHLAPAAHTVHGWQVDQLTPHMDTLLGHGVAFLRFDGLPQDKHAVWTTPDGAKIAWFKDPSGNILSLTQLP